MPINTGNINDLYNLEIMFRGQDSKKIIFKHSTAKFNFKFRISIYQR